MGTAFVCAFLGECSILFLKVFYDKVGIVGFEILKSDGKKKVFHVLVRVATTLSLVELGLLVLSVTLPGFSFSVWHSERQITTIAPRKQEVAVIVVSYFVGACLTIRWSTYGFLFVYLVPFSRYGELFVAPKMTPSHYPIPAAIVVQTAMRPNNRCASAKSECNGCCNQVLPHKQITYLTSAYKNCA